MRIKERLLRAIDATGMTFLDPLVRLVAGEDPREQLRKVGLYIVTPVVSFGLFLAAWTGVASSLETPYGSLPTPRQVWDQGAALVDAHFESRRAEAEFYAQQGGRAEALAAEAAELRTRARTSPQNERGSLENNATVLEKRSARAVEAKYSASPTYLEQILTSLYTVFAGFVIASAVAIPVGILCGLSPVFTAAVNPLIQVFKPVSPLAWLPIVMIVVATLYTTEPQEAWFEKSFISSAITVALCSLWPTLVNTALGVSSIERDHLNVARVLRLGWWTKIRKIVVPSTLPLMFTGLRISLGVGWMVLIAAEMLAQNPGLGKFVWDMFQNGSSQTMAQIIVAVFTIGSIGFLLDRAMLILQKTVTYDSGAA